jgi:hypothetical protein
MNLSYNKLKKLAKVLWGSIFKTTQLRGGQFILKTFGCKKKLKVNKTKQNK